MNYTHLEDRKPIARKPHRCYLCGRAIEAGQKHVRRVGATDDGIDSIRMHVGCEEKTSRWDQDTWEAHDPVEFRRYELEEPSE